MHAAAQIQTQTHRLQADSAQPFRRARRKRQRDDVGITQLVIKCIACLQLRLDRFETQNCPTLVQRQRGKGNLVVFQPQPDLTRFELLQRHAGAATDLNRRIFAKQVWQREKQTHDNNGEDQQVLPTGVSIHKRAGRASGGFDRALGHHCANRVALNLDLHAGRYLDRRELIGKLRHFTEHTTRRNDFVTH